MSPRRPSDEPMLRKRFIMHARYLRELPAFLTALKAARAQWDARFPEFAVRTPEVPQPDELNGFGPFRNAYPRKLDHALIRLQKLTADGPPADEKRAAREAEDKRAVHAVAEAWVEVADNLARKWWPEEYFPLWSTRQMVRHPAIAFVTACLAWGPTFADEGWVMPLPALSVSGWSFDPDEGHPEGTYWRTYAEQIEAVLAEMVPKERLDGVRTEAAEVALAARLADQNRSLDEAVWVVRLVSGMTSSDWRHIESQVLSLMDTLYPPLPLRQLAHRLRSRGWGYRRIAGELGVSVTHVRRLLDPDENSPS